MTVEMVTQNLGERYVDIKELQARYRVSPSTIYGWLKGLGLDPEALAFPQPQKFGRSTRWSLRALEEWEAGQPNGVHVEGKFRWQRQPQDLKATEHPPLATSGRVKSSKSRVKAK